MAPKNCIYIASCANCFYLEISILCSNKRECQLSPGATSAHLFVTLVTGMGTGPICLLGTSTICVLGAGTICVLGASTICVLGASTICVLGAGTIWPQQPGYDALSALPLNGQGLPSSSTSLQPALLSLPSPSPSPNTQIQIQKYK